MKNKFVKVFGILFIVLLVTGCGCSKKKEEPKKEETKKEENVNAPVIKYRDLKNLKIGTAEVSVVGEKTVVSVSIKNETSGIIDVKNIKVILKDSSGNVLHTFDEKLDPVNPGESILLKDAVEKKLTTVATVDYE